MQPTTLLASLATALSFMAPVSAGSNASPMLVLSNEKPLQPHGLSTLSATFAEVQSLVADAAASCQYTSYIFVHHPNVTENGITKSTMPFLTHALDKAKSAFEAYSVQDGDEANALKTVKLAIESKCDASSLNADINSETPIPALSDESARIISVEFPQETKPEDADEVLKKIVGHLPSGNFFMFYQTTPVEPRPLKDSPLFKILGDDDSTDAEMAAELPGDNIFRNYQFFSPGLFMGIIASVLLIVVLLIALNSVGSLQISQAAFEPKHDPIKKRQ